MGGIGRIDVWPTMMGWVGVVCSEEDESITLSVLTFDQIEFQNNLRNLRTNSISHFVLRLKSNVRLLRSVIHCMMSFLAVEELAGGRDVEYLHLVL